MELEEKRMRGTVCEGYVVLLRADASVVLPTGRERMSDFYLSLAQKCMTWALEVRGEWVRAAYLACKSLEERSRFGVEHYRLGMRVPWEDENTVAVVVESVLTMGNGRESLRYLAQLWKIDEETLYPIKQAAELLGVGKELGRLSFRPDGLYPENGQVVFFKNSEGTAKPTEERFALSVRGEKKSADAEK